MVDSLRSSVWLYRLVFLGLAAAFLFLKLLPLGSVAGEWPGPDILLCLIFAWVVRRPDFLPVPLIAAVLLLEDLLLMRPPGLWTALVILATEFIRSRAALTRELGFVTEWLLVAGMMAALLISYRLAFAFAFLPQPSFGFALVQTVWSILCYPLVVAASRLAFDLRKPATGEVDAYGKRL
ncbi:rod shape-determining protein MreD [Fuscovulum ytuae]|uniref:Rod shape-determining protein MreD n=1 Tax=Fuscovulum ytuae TaxID=3042299 RepID=A0ABY8Q788_9RHOB|nr:rod shape-determining protein MreD [Fuscovulum sp. YMD61]WGV16152.1 rod shape-determining protein MreD [Fuscovulum sp. YMD61]